MTRTGLSPLRKALEMSLVHGWERASREGVAEESGGEGAGESAEESAGESGEEIGRVR
ncbi:hypothetical protein [Streptosporangium sp. NPDC002524]|uniref:hypothetical protein n=1 Tax=Streptosporangium sp. NPDC002524 TaxID=3154537 RepID=UPI00331A6C91